VTLRDELIDRFAWVDGHADIWRLFSDGELLRRIASALAEPFPDVTKIAGIESRGFILGSAVAVELGVGFAAIRKPGGLFPGPKATRRTGPDYRSSEHLLSIQREAVGRGDRVLVVDDWAEVGAQAVAARELIEDCGASFAGLAIVVDQLEDAARERLGSVHALVTADELGPSG
jgi:adenine phosphoribosyltransferase